MSTFTVLRTSIVTTALAGVLLAPSASSAAPAPAVHTPSAVSVTSSASASSSASSSASASAASRSASPDPSDDGRYGGETVLVGRGRLAVLRNGPEGPEVWLRAVAPDWEPGDGWAGRVLAKLDPSHPRAVLDGGTRYELTGSGDGRYALTVRERGESAPHAFHPLPISWAETA